MKQFNFFNEQIIIPGLKYTKDYIKTEHEHQLIELIDSMPWITELKRRVQHYGYKYDYSSKSINSLHYLGTIPDWLNVLCTKLFNDRIFLTSPNQVIINEYLPGQGIAPHIDCIPYFSDTICSLSLFSSCVMDFTNNTTKQSIELAPKSLLILKEEARYKWKHGIAPRQSDNGIKRQRRISLTFRKVVLD